MEPKSFANITKSIRSLYQNTKLFLNFAKASEMATTIPQVDGIWNLLILNMHSCLELQNPVDIIRNNDTASLLFLATNWVA